MTAPSTDGVADVEGVRRVRVSFRSVVLGVATILAVVVLRNAFVAAHRILGWAVASAAVATFLEPFVNWLGRRIPRMAAVLLTFLLVAAAAIGLVFGSVDDLDREVSRLQRAAPEATAQLEARDDEFGGIMRDLEVSDRIQVFLDALDARVGSGGGALAQNAPTAPIYFVNAILTIFLLVYGPAIYRGGVDRIGDETRRGVVQDAIFDALTRARRTVAAMLAQGALVGVLVWGVAIALDLPAPIVLGLVTGVVGMLPDFGILLGIVPTLGFVAGLHSVRLAVALFVAAFIVQSFEALVLRDRIDRWGVAIGPAVVWIVALLSFTIYGVGAAIFGVCYAVFIVGLVDQVPAARERLATAT